MTTDNHLRIGIDLGGTKIAGLAFGPGDIVLAENRAETPRENYEQSIAAISNLVLELESIAGGSGSVGIGIPGSRSPATGLIQNANSTWLNGRPFHQDLERALNRPVRMANDANCFALSEATDGAAAHARSVFGVIVGTGCGGGIVIDGRIVDGPNAIGGEWGHTPLPTPRDDERPGLQCWCGRLGCMETWVSGPAVAADHQRVTGMVLRSEEIAVLARSGDEAARATLERLADRLARGLATITNVLDPEVIVLGGGLSSIDMLYELITARLEPLVFADHATINVRPPKWGPASGVRGAARLWP